MSERMIGPPGGELFFVFDADDTGDMSCEEFDTKEEALERIEEEDDRCHYLLSITYVGGGNFKVETEPFT